MADPFVLTTRSRLRLRRALAVAAALAVSVPGAALAQGGSQPVVQAVPPPSLEELNSALKDLTNNPRDVSAMLRAGWASLALNQQDAAVGFFKRAEALQPQNGEVKSGLALASLHAGDPVRAVQLFAQAEAAGTPTQRFDSDRGLALDLVGNNSAAQQYYRRALTQKYDAETIRRLALSQAISGDQAGAEATLLPLLQARDLAAYRTRAFALAILGKGEEAVSIVQTMLPGDIASKMAPYLRYMPRLTRAQQAAAANLGEFPPASQIGRDDPRIAAFSGVQPPTPAVPQVAANDPGARLVPAGPPLGRGERRSRGKAAAAPAPSRTAPTAAATPSPPPAAPPSVATRTAPQVAANTTVPPLPNAAPRTVPQVAAATPQPLPAPARPATAAPAAQTVPGTTAPQTAPAASKPVLVASLAPTPAAPTPTPAAPAPQPEAPRPSFSVSAPTPPPGPPPERVSLAEAFAEFAKLPQSGAAPAPGAVDVTKLKAAPAPEAQQPAKAADETRADSRAESKTDSKADSKADAKAKGKGKKAEAKPKPPANPSRVWVQVGTGRDLKALAFTWKRVEKDAGRLLAKQDAYTAKWGRTRRLLVGPYKSADQAQDAVAALKKKGLDAFTFTSDEGEDVAPLS